MEFWAPGFGPVLTITALTHTHTTAELPGKWYGLSICSPPTRVHISLGALYSFLGTAGVS